MRRDRVGALSPAEPARHGLGRALRPLRADALRPLRADASRAGDEAAVIRYADLGDRFSLMAEVGAAFESYRVQGFPRPPDAPRSALANGPRPLAPEEVEQLVRDWRAVTTRAITD